MLTDMLTQTLFTFLQNAACHVKTHVQLVNAYRIRQSVWTSFACFVEPAQMVCILPAGMIVAA